MKWKCPVCGKEYEQFGLKDFAMCSKTTLFGNFNRYVLKSVKEKVKSNILWKNIKETKFIV